jgi:hypothetical protein
MQLLVNLTRLGIRVESHEDRLRYAPRSAVSSNLAERMRVHKTELLAMLAADPVSDEDKRRGYETAVAEANRLYRGGTIDWTKLDSISDRILRASSRGELTQAVAEYATAIVT